MQTLTDLYRYRFILTNLVSKNLKAMYRNMALGFLWTLLNPIIFVTVLSFVWTHFTARLLITLIPYNFFVYCLTGCVSVIPGNANLVKRVAFPRQILPVSVILTHLIHFFAQFGIVICYLIIMPPPNGWISWAWIWLPVVLVVHLGLCMGVGLLVSALNVVYRDVTYIVESTITILFWLCPILYLPEPMFAEKFPEWGDVLHYIYYSNPLAGILDSYTNILFYGSRPSFEILGIALIGTLIIGAIGVRAFWIHEKEFADLV